MTKLSVKTALYISIGLIFLEWFISVIRNTLYIDSVLALFESMPRVFLLTFITGLITIIVVAFLLRLSKEQFRDIGFNKNNVGKQVRNGCLFGVAIFILDTFMISPLSTAILPSTSAQGIDMAKLFSNVSYIVIFVFIGLFKGGLSEEIGRIFVLTRFEKIFGKKGLIFALIVSSLMFGTGHLYQGLSGMISISIIGLLYALVYLRKRSALEAVFAHSTENTISIILGYIIYAG